MASRGIRSGFHAYANEYTANELHSGIYNFPTLATALSLQGAVNGKLTPDSRLVIGKSFSAARAKTMAGSTQLNGFFQTGDISGTKVIGTDDTGSSAGAERVSAKKKGWQTSWTEYETPVAIDNQLIDAAKGGHAVGSLIEDATQIATASQLAVLAQDLYTGAPTSYTDDVYSGATPGLDEWLGKANNVFGIDRSLAANAGFRAQHSTATLALSFSTLEDIIGVGVNDGSAGTTASLNSKGSKGDIILVPEAGYNKLKKEALALHLIQHTSNGKDLPNSGMVGYLNEYINWNGRMICPDPYAAASSLYILDSNAISIEFFAGKNFTTSKFVNLRDLQPGTGQNNLTTAALCTKLRMMVWEPWKCFKGTAIS